MKKSRKQNRTKNRLHSKADQRIPFVEHLYELRKRLFRIALSVVGLSLAAYVVQQRLVNILLVPARGQHFIYTSPGGGLNFLFSVCLYTGIALSIPVIVYQVLKYFEPLFKDDATVRFIARGSVVSGIFAVAGIAFGYYVGLPAVLQFLFHQFKSQQIEPLVTIQSYMSFVTVYMLGSALLLQVPLVLLFINRIKPLKPSGLFKKERWVILGSFVASGIMNPTPNIFSQLMVAGPIILMYQVGIVIIWYSNRRSRHSPHVALLLERDAQARASREATAKQLELYYTPERLEPLNKVAQVKLSPEKAPFTATPHTPNRPARSFQRTVQRRPYFTDVRPAYSRLPQAE